MRNPEANPGHAYAHQERETEHHQRAQAIGHYRRVRSEYQGDEHHRLEPHRPVGLGGPAGGREVAGDFGFHLTNEIFGAALGKGDCRSGHASFS